MLERLDAWERHEAPVWDVIEQIESLRVELDDLETDMDHELTRELEVTERLRRTEIDMCEELWLAKERREIARQRTRWAIRGVRKAVIRRDYDARRDKAVDAEIERRGGLAALGREARFGTMCPWYCCVPVGSPPATTAHTAITCARKKAWKR